MAQLGDGVGPEPSTCLLPSRARAEHPPAAFPRTRPSTGLLPSRARACCLRVPGLSTSLLRCVAGPSDRLLPSRGRAERPPATMVPSRGRAERPPAACPGRARARYGARLRRARLPTRSGGPHACGPFAAIGAHHAQIAESLLATLHENLRRFALATRESTPVSYGRAPLQNLFALVAGLTGVLDVSDAAVALHAKGATVARTRNHSCFLPTAGQPGALTAPLEIGLDGCPRSRRRPRSSRRARHPCAATRPSQRSMQCTPARRLPTISAGRVAVRLW